MAQTAIFGPFFATMLLTLLVWVYMYIRRISFITKNNSVRKTSSYPVRWRDCRLPQCLIPRTT
jgi:hypothetical protein